VSRHVVATVGEVAPGTCKIVTVEGREIGVFNVAGSFYALLNRCPHEGAELCRGRIVGLVQSDGPGDYRLTRPNEMIRCPWHGWEFDIRTGQSWCDPKKTRVKRYDASVASGDDLVKGPYVAETYEVTVEENYVVIEM